MEINQYPLESFAFQDEDYYDIDFWTGSGYQTKKILGSVIKAGILSGVVNVNIYNSDGSLTGDRNVTLDGGNLILKTNSNDQTTFEGFKTTITSSLASGEDAGLVISSPNDLERYIELQNNGLKRWKIRTFNNEVGGDTGSDLVFQSYNDIGAPIGEVLKLTRTGGIRILASYNLPNTDGTNGQVMTTDGAGVVSWQDSAVSAVNIYNTDGTLTGSRIVDLNSEAIAFQDSNASGGSFIVNIDNGTKLCSFTMQPNVFDLQSLNLALGSVITGTPTSLLLKYFGASGIKQMQINNGGLRINGQYYLPNTDGTSGQVVTTDGAGNLSFQPLPAEIQVAASDEITALSVGNGKTTFRLPYGITLTGVRASLTTAQTSGTIFTADIIYNGVSVLSTKLTIDNTEKTSTTATTPAVITTSALDDDGEIRIDITQIGDSTAKGLKVTLIGTRQ